MTALVRRNDTYGLLVLMLIFTAQRREEVAGMAWSEIDITARIWTIPTERSKNARAHRIYLSDQAMAILAQVPRFTGSDLVFSASGQNQYSRWSQAKKALDRDCGVTGWRLHDIRRTIVTHMAANGVPPHVADKLLSHKTGAINGVAAVYQQHDFFKEQSQALINWGHDVEAMKAGYQLVHC